MGYSLEMSVKCNDKVSRRDIKRREASLGSSFWYYKNKRTFRVPYVSMWGKGRLMGW